MFGRACRYVYRHPSTAWLLLRMAGWVATLSLLIRMLPLPSILRLMQPRVRSHAAMPDPATTQEHLARLLDLLLATEFLFLTPTCWKRATVLHRYLGLQGIGTRIVFGVRKEDEELLAGHAWLEADGKPLLETALQSYTVPYSFPA